MSHKDTRLINVAIVHVEQNYVHVICNHRPCNSDLTLLIARVSEECNSPPSLNFTASFAVGLLNNSA